MRKKHCEKKEKLLIMSNFSFSHSIFKRLVLKTRKTQGLFGKGLRWGCESVPPWFHVLHVHYQLHQWGQVLSVQASVGFDDPQSSVGSVPYLKTGGGHYKFDPWLGQYSLPQDSFLSHYYLLFRQWSCWKAASGMERILWRVLVKRTWGKHG